jgi:hypothetical protein
MLKKSPMIQQEKPGREKHKGSDDAKEEALISV